MSALALLASQEILGRLHATAQALVGLEVMPLETEADRAQASALVQATSALLAEADSVRAAEKKPHLDAGREVDAAFKAATAPLATLDRTLRARLAEAAQKARKAEIAALEAARVAVLTQDARAATEALATIPEELPKLDGIGERWSWSYTVQDLAAVPESFTHRVLNEDAIQAEIKAAEAQGRRPVVPGLAFEPKVSVIVRKGAK